MIKSSSHRLIDRLIRDLSSNRAVRRETAIARLGVIGTRAVERLVALASDRQATPIARTAALRTLQAIEDPRGLDAALQHLGDADSGVACAAIGFARGFLRGTRGTTVVDQLTVVVLDRRRDDQVRLVALQALRGLEPSTVKPLLQALENDPGLAAKLRLNLGTKLRDLDGQPQDGRQLLEEAACRSVPDDPARIRRAISHDAEHLSLSLVHGLIERIRERESTEGGARRREWTTARAAAHVALANRGSRLALYDIRETLQTATEPLPVEFLRAIAAIGDASCLESIAVAYARASASHAREDWWRRHLADAFRTIVTRERITKRHAVMKRIQKRWPKIVDSR